MNAPQPRRILRIALSVPDLEAARRFYADALGFEPVAFDPAHGVARMRLGGQEIELRPGDGAPYPAPRRANDPWLQHFAIAVSDMDAAYSHLERFDGAPISRGGPQRLPPSTGSVTAYKFRDPDGHPLELSHIPKSEWDGRTGSGPFLGIDHTAMAVRDLDASIAFYTEALGFALDARLLNTGPEQDRLDGLDGVALDIVVLKTAAPGAHIELLHYRAPRSTEPPREIGPADVAATRLVVETDDLAALESRLRSRGAAIQSDDGALALQDPDGHRLILVGPRV